MELIISFLFIYIMIFMSVFYFTIIYMIKNIKFKKVEHKSNNNKDIKTLFDELNTLKGIQHKTKDTLRNIVRKLPFKGEEWMQEFIREDVDESIRRYEENQAQESAEPAVDNEYDYHEERRNFNDRWSKIFHDSVQQRLDDMIMSVSG
jgi:hypothetical protein